MKRRASTPTLGDDNWGLQQQIICDGKPLQTQVLESIVAEEWKVVKSMISSPKLRDEMSTQPLVFPATLLHIVCSVPTTPESVIDVVLTNYPDACYVTDEDGNLPIHLSCVSGAIRPEVIKMLLLAGPETSFVPSQGEQELPLYVIIRHCLHHGGVHCANNLLSALPSSIIFNNQTSVLHQVCSGILPEPIILALIQKYPAICKIHNNGNTLLHIMCSHEHCTAALVEAIVTDFPEATAIRDEDGNVPLHLVNSHSQGLEIIRILLQVYPQALYAMNAASQTPLLSPLIRNSSQRIKELLHFSHPEDTTMQKFVLTRNNSGMCPIHDFFYVLQKQVTDLVSRNSISIDDLSSYGRMEYTKLLSNHLESMFYLMRVAVYNNVEYTMHKFSHQESFWVSFPLFTKILLHHSPELACHKDCDGNLPIHVISNHTFHQTTPTRCSCCRNKISGPHLWFPNGVQTCSKCVGRHAMPTPLIEYQGLELIKDVLAVNPGAASIQDSKGNLPLHQSIKSGKTWSTGVCDLINAAPQALEVRDIETSLPPFLLAASSEEYDQKFSDGEKLTTVYELLKRNPSQMQL